MTSPSDFKIDQLKFDENGLVTAVIQDYRNNEILMVAHMNREAVEITLKGPYVAFWSRSRKKIWIKGEESGHTQEVKEVFFDCDADALLIKADQKVATCHEGYRTDFFRKIENGKIQIVGKKIFEPKDVYKK